MMGQARSERMGVCVRRFKGLSLAKKLLIAAAVLIVGHYLTSCMWCNLSGPRIQYFPTREWSNNKNKLILLWTPRFGYDYWDVDPHYRFGDCAVNTCRLTNNKSRLAESDAVLFHSRALWNNYMGITMPPYHPPHQVWIFNTQEPPAHVYINLKNYKGVFNWTSTYRLDSDVPGLQSKLVKLDAPTIGWREETDQALLHRGQQVGPAPSPKPSGKGKLPNYHAQKTKFIAWTASNCIDQSRRQRVVNQLRKYLPVDTYGRCGDNPLKCRDFKCSSVLETYRFYLSFENGLCKDYITEKFFLALTRHQIPVVYSGADYTKHVPKNTYIDVNDFRSLKHLADYIVQVNADPALYNSYMWWKQYYQVNEFMHVLLFCEMCIQLHDKSKRAQVYTDINQWYQDDTCSQFSITDLVSRFIEGKLLYYGLIS